MINGSVLLCDYMIGRNHFNTINEGIFFCPYSQRSHLNLLTCLEGLDAFSYFSLNTECPEGHIGAQDLPKLAPIFSFSVLVVCSTIYKTIDSEYLWVTTTDSIIYYC